MKGSECLGRLRLGPKPGSRQTEIRVGRSRDLKVEVRGEGVVRGGRGLKNHMTRPCRLAVVSIQESRHEPQWHSKSVSVNGEEPDSSPPSDPQPFSATRPL